MVRDTRAAALALHRFGLGPRAGAIEAIAPDPQAALMSELDQPGAGLVAAADLLSSGAANRAVFEFNAERTALVFPASVLDHRLAGDDPEQFRILEAQAHARDDLGVVFRLRRTLRILLLAQGGSGDQVAKLLLMHHRTLNRRLKAEGTTFQELLDEVRFEAA